MAVAFEAGQKFPLDPGFRNDRLRESLDVWSKAFLNSFLEGKATE